MTVINPSPNQKRLAAAIGISLALHAAALFFPIVPAAFSPPQGAPDRSAVLTVFLEEASFPENTQTAPAAPALASASVPQAQETKEQLFENTKREYGKTFPDEEVFLAGREPALEAPAAASAVSPPAAQDLRPHEESGGTANAVLSGPGAVVPMNEDDKASLLAEIREKIQSRLRYPPLARRRGIQGTVGLTLEIGCTGELLRLELRESSGSVLLDNDAQALARKIFPLKEKKLSTPESLGITIRYSLEDGGPGF